MPHFSGLFPAESISPYLGGCFGCCCRNSCLVVNDICYGFEQPQTSASTSVYQNRQTHDARISRNWSSAADQRFKDQICRPDPAGLRTREDGLPESLRLAKEEEEEEEDQRQQQMNA